jgi:sugar phosphate isomerase/epimerase
MKLGFLTACLQKMSLEEISKWANHNGFEMLEIACWPKKQNERRYIASHIDVESFGEEELTRVERLKEKYRLEISSLAFYSNNLDPDLKNRIANHVHLKKVIEAAQKLDVKVVGTFIGRNPKKNIEESLDEFEKVFPELVKFAEDHEVKLAIENCPMIYSIDQWPGGTNLAATPETWRRMFEIIPSPNFGLNLDPSHLIWQQIDYIKAVHDFKDRIFHIHAKDTKILWNKLNEVGIFGFGWRLDKVAGMGDIDWKLFITSLYESDYDYVISIEHEDESFGETEENYLRGILIAKKLLENYIV